MRSAHPSRHRSAPYSGRVLACCAALAVTFIGAACQPELPETAPPVTGPAWLAAAARVHDPSGHWALFRHALTLDSYLADGRFGWRETLYIDRARDTFSRAILESGALLTQELSAQGCRAHWDNPEPTPEQIADFGLDGEDCSSVERRRRYHEFLLGLPMSVLESERVEVEATVGSEPYWAGDAVVVAFYFPDDAAGERWWLAIDPGDYHLVGARFAFARGGDEIYHYEELVWIDGFWLAGRRIVSLDSARQVLVDQRLTFEP